MTKLKNPVLLAVVGAPHGIRGEVRVKSFTGDPLALGDYGALSTSDGQKLVVSSLRPSKNVVIVRFKGVTTREAAEALRNVELFVDRSALPPEEDEDDFYVADLIGLRVEGVDGKALGVVVDVPDFGAGSLLEVGPSIRSRGAQTWYVELTRDNVPTIDIDGGLIVVAPPEEVSERDT